jgi:hypothetical protein
LASVDVAERTVWPSGAALLASATASLAAAKSYMRGARETLPVRASTSMTVADVPLTAIEVIRARMAPGMPSSSVSIAATHTSGDCSA